MHMQHATVLLLCIHVLLCATKCVQSSRRTHVDVTEIDESLFPLRRANEAFAPIDHFQILNDARREAWTFTHEMVRAGQGLPSTMLEKLKSIREEGLAVDVEIRLIGFDQWRSMSKEELQNYAKALMGGTGKGRTNIRVRINWASVDLNKDIYRHGEVEGADVLAKVFEKDSKGRMDTNLLYVIEEKDTSSDRANIHRIWAEGGRVAWMIHGIQASRIRTRFIDVVLGIGKALADTFAPLPRYFPVPLVEHLRIRIYPYTPHSSHRASWLNGFQWSIFESAVRSISLRGQHVGFFPNQVNAELPKEALSVLRNSVDNSNFDLDSTLRKISFGSDFWATKGDHGSGGTSLYIYVIDASQLSRSEGSLLDRKSLVISPGLAIITLKPGSQKTKEKLYNYLVSAVAGSAFGIDETVLSSRNLVLTTTTSHALLNDIATNNVVSSLIDESAKETEVLLSLLTDCNLEPNQALTLRTFTYFHQRLNLLLYRIVKAKEAFEHGDNDASIHYAASSRHDVQAVRKILRLEKVDLKDLQRGTSSCQLFHIGDNASLASRIFTAATTAPSRGSWFLILVCCALGVGGVKVATEKYLRNPAMRKRGKYD
eukprot:Plantae.Rhodophyta-Hildenbrandia_rubra.ctg10393.p1 GENE.Plantae.Rhodophyta-Hildenbrandia_rubra.ctg10393~~Plantae.Rhodophyta-Hildenbrandia_rubra.ctg10393.p1  ORF type:complete len:599 (+),score=61.45 Plantae.Rhodophyta-Hildenbrandia_rubra.ctg10393:291-2087(+)